MNILFRDKLLLVPVSKQAKITFISVTVGITLLGFVARLLRRRRRSRPKSAEIAQVTKAKGQNYGSSINGDVASVRGGTNLGLYRHHRQGSICSDRQSIHSLLTANLNLDAASAALTPQQLGTMGMEALETSIAYWEDALAAYRPPPGEVLALTDSEDGKFTHMLERILEKAYRLQESCSLLFLDSNSVLFQSESQSVVSSRHERTHYLEPERRTMTSMSSLESFVSAQAEIADLDDFEEYDLHLDIKELPLYQTAVKKCEEGGIPIRLLRTEMVRCQSNKEYISKVHCIRVAFQLLFQQEDIRTYFLNVGNKVLTGLMLRGEKDPKDCLVAYDDIISFVKDKKNWIIMEEELSSRSVKCMSFYDIVLDFIVLDGFEDLENPPSSVTAVVQNRWLSNGFKETALATAVWSVLKAKKRMLKYPDGFIGRFYHVSEHLIPVLAWGFYGPDEKLKEICLHFKEEMMGFLFDIFNFNKVRFTKVEELASDIMQQANMRFDRTIQRLYMQNILMRSNKPEVV